VIGPWILLTNVKSDLRLHVAGNSTAPSAFVEVYNEDAPIPLKSSSWRITEEKPKAPSADGQPTTYAIANSRSKWWLNIRNYEHPAGTRIEQWVLPEHGHRKPEGRDYALWIFEPAGPKDVAGTSTAPQEDSAPKETTPPVRCGGKFDSYVGRTYKGTYTSKSATLPEGASKVGRAKSVPTPQAHVPFQILATPKLPAGNLLTPFSGRAKLPPTDRHCRTRTGSWGSAAPRGPCLGAVDEQAALAVRAGPWTTSRRPRTVLSRARSTP